MHKDISPQNPQHLLNLQYDDNCVTGLALARLIDCDNAVFQFLAHNRKTPEGAGINNSD